MRSTILGAVIAIFGLAAAHASDKPLTALDPGQIKAGRMVYEKHCAVCHGVRAEGATSWQQPDAQGELPAPPHDPEGHTWKHSDAMLYRIVMQGWRDPFNKTTRLTMPAFAGILSPQEVRAVIGYLKTLWRSEQQRFQREESRNQSFP